MTVTVPPPPAEDFTRVPNEELRDFALTYAEKGVLAYIRSHAATYSLTMEQIVAEGAEGADAVRSILRSLERKGYLTRTPVRGYRGRIVRYDYTVTRPAYGLAASDPTASGETACRPTASGEAATSHDQGEHPVSPGGTGSPETATGEPEAKKTITPTGEKISKKTREPSQARGTRLPEGWTPSPELMSWFLEELVAGGAWSEASREACRREHANFADYWAAATGAKAVKKDWVATWRVWMRRAFPRPIASSGPPPTAGRQSFAEQDAARREHGDRRAAAIDAFMEANPGVSVREAAKIVDAEIAKRVDGRTGGPYIEGDIARETDPPREVTS